MFAKKPATPKTPWAVRVLTPDFLVDGFSDNEAHPESWPFFTAYTDAATKALLWLDSPRFTPVTTGGAQPPADVKQWVAPYGGQHVAVLPGDEASLEAMRKNTASHKYAFAAVLHAGPFSVRGKLLSSYEKVSDLSLMATFPSFAVQEAEIEYRLPNPHFTGLKAPLALVRTHWIQGIGLV